MPNCGVRFRAYPNKDQKDTLSQWIGCARVIYNCKVDEDHKAYKAFKLDQIKTPVNQAYSQFKTQERHWLGQCPSQVLRNSASIWYTAKQRFFKGLSGNPTYKRRGDRDSVLLTNELFRFEDSALPDGSFSRILIIGTKKNPVGQLSFVAHRPFGEPKQIVVSKKAGQWFVSFCYEVEEVLDGLSEQELLDHYSALDQETLQEYTVGIDRGIVKPLQLSDSSCFDFGPEAQKKFKRTAAKIVRVQKSLSRAKKGSQNRYKLKLKLSKCHQKQGNRRQDFAHKTSHSIANLSAKVVVVEDLSLKNMTKAPAPKQDENGKYLPNKRAAKAGLNKKLLEKGLAKTVSYLEYKCQKQGKLLVKIPAPYTSQECAKCHHIHPDNRKTQADFQCISCGHQDNADVNAAKVIAYRGIKYLQSRPKAKTRTRLGSSRSQARRGVSQTERAQVFSADAQDPGSSLL